MMTKPRTLLQGSLALASAVLVAACGGGSAGAPDIFAPTVQITSDAAATATGPVTYTFTFSEDVGTSFTDADVLVSAGTVGSLTKASATQYTLVVTPPAATSGTIQVSVVAGAVSDAAGNVSTVSPTVATAFNTVVPGSSGSTGTCTGACIDFASATVKYAPFGAMVAAGQASDPADIANKVARVVKGPGSEVWAGVTIYTVDAGQSVPAFDLSTSKVVTLRVYAPAAGIPIMLKLENAANPGVFLEKKAVTTLANAWETLSFDYASPDNGSYSSANAYDKVSVFPNFLAAETSERAYLFDELKYTAAAGGGTLTFSSGFAGGNRTVEGGAYFAYSGSNLDGFNCSGDPAWCGSGDGGSGATSFYYAYYQTPTPATALYNGISVLAPGVTAVSSSGDTPGLQLSGQTAINFNFNNNPEWQASGTNNFGVLLTLGKFYDLDAGTGVTPCNIKLLAVVTPLNNGATAPYSVPLSAFQVIQACNTGISTVAAALASAPVSEIAFQAAGGGAALPPVGGKTTGANLSVANSGGLYPTTLALTGGITFTGSSTPAPTTVDFSTGFAGGNRTVEGGAYFSYSGSNLDGFNCSGDPAWCGSGAGGSGAASYYFAYYQTPTPATALYNGISVMAPGVTALNTAGDTAGVQLNGQTTVNFMFNNNPEWQASGTNNFGVILTLGKFYDLDAGAGVTPCNVKLLAVVTPENNGAAAPYKLPLSSFQVIQACNTGISTVAAALASSPVSEVAFQAAGGGAALPTVGGKTTGANLSVANSGGLYPTTLALTGGISFEP